jgi:hypothetical protein
MCDFVTWNHGMYEAGLEITQHVCMAPEYQGLGA